MLAGTTKSFHIHLLTGDSFNDVRAGNEHMRRLIDHHNIVGQGGGVGGTASTRTHNHRDLRNHTGGTHIHTENIGKHCQRRHTLLDACAAAVINTDDGAPVLQRELLHLHDLLAVHLREGTAVHRKILRVHGNKPPINSAVARNQAIPQRLLLIHAEGGGAVPRHCVELHKRSLVQKHVNTLTRRLLPARMLLFDGCLTAGVNGLLAPGKEIGEFTGCGAQVKFLLSLLRHVFLNFGRRAERSSAVLGVRTGAAGSPKLRRTLPYNYSVNEYPVPDRFRRGVIFGCGLHAPLADWQCTNGAAPAVEKTYRLTRGSSP